MLPNLTPHDVERFWSKVDRSGECWLWTAAKDPHGYGRFGYRRRAFLAHRIAWQIMNGPIPDGMFVLHDCPTGDNPTCVRHLWLGTQIDNLGDAVAKGRTARGERIGSAKLTADDVREIRQRYATGNVSQRTLAADYGVDQSHISDIVRHNRWEHLP